MGQDRREIAHGKRPSDQAENNEPRVIYINRDAKDLADMDGSPQIFSTSRIILPFLGSKCINNIISPKNGIYDDYYCQYEQEQIWIKYH